MDSKSIERYALQAWCLIYLYLGFGVIVRYYYTRAISSEPKELIVPMVLSTLLGAIYSGVNYKLSGRVFSKTVVNTFTVTLVITLLALFIGTLLKSIYTFDQY